MHWYEMIFFAFSQQSLKIIPNVFHVLKQPKLATLQFSLDFRVCALEISYLSAFPYYIKLRLRFLDNFCGKIEMLQMQRN